MNELMAIGANIYSSMKKFFLNQQVHFTQPEWAVTPGQSIVFYKEEECLGGGVINQMWN